MIDLKCNYDSAADPLAYGDLELDANGNPSFTESGSQHQFDLLMATQGDYKHFPEIGVDSFNYVNDTDPTAYLRAVRKHFTAAGMKVRSVAFSGDGKLEIDASYEKR